MATMNDLLASLARHIGRDRGVASAALAKELGIKARQVRGLIQEARLEGVAVCGHPNTGYFIASNTDELEQTCKFLRARGLASFMQVSRLTKIALPDLLGQLHITA